MKLIIPLSILYSIQDRVRGFRSLAQLVELTTRPREISFDVDIPDSSVTCSLCISDNDIDQIDV